MLLPRFPLTFLQTRKWIPLFITQLNYSRTDRDGLHDHLREVSWEDIFNLVFQLLLLNFVSGSLFESMYLSLIVNIRSSLTHLHSFQLLVLLP